MIDRTGSNNGLGTVYNSDEIAPGPNERAGDLLQSNGGPKGISRRESERPKVTASLVCCLVPFAQAADVFLIKGGPWPLGPISREE